MQTTDSIERRYNSVASDDLYACGRVRVVLVEMTDKVLGPFAPRLRKYTANELRACGIELRLGTAVTQVREDSVVLSDGQTLPSAATIWASGVRVHDDVSQWGLPQGRGGRL
ncbi:MAG: FAD-dependent oxidoreductase [Egibacteraceae bacterium]